jgi:hypothetical protein
MAVLITRCSTDGALPERTVCFHSAIGGIGTGVSTGSTVGALIYEATLGGQKFSFEANAKK